MTRIYLLRHGATALNRLRPYRLQGQRIDPPLDELGIDQARRAAGAFAGLPISAIYASPLIRALETARAIARSIEVPVVAVEAIAEADLGRWEGLTWDQARDQDPEHFDEFMARPGTTPYPGGESFLDVRDRVAPAIASLADRHPGGHVVVVGHNVVNRAYLAGLLGLPIDRARGIKQSNCGINVIEFEDAKPTLLCLNAILHLDPDRT